MKSIVLLLTLFCLCQGNDCPKGWSRSNDRCYYISGKEDTFDGANKYCKDRKSQLAPGLTCGAHMNLVEVLAAYRRKCRGQNCNDFWIGIKELNASNWRTGNDLLIKRNRQCQQWAKRFPRGNGTCGTMNLIGTLKRGAWKNVDCTRRFKYVCISCPSDFDYVPEINKCLYFNLNVANWSNAQKNCAKMKKGAHLMTIHDSTKQKAVENYMKLQIPRKEKESEICLSRGWSSLGRMPWLGGQTKIPDVCGTPYVWKQLGVPDIPFTYSNWFPGMPDCNAGENCAVFPTSPLYNFRWEDLRCWYELCSLCEF